MLKTFASAAFVLSCAGAVAQTAVPVTVERIVFDGKPNTILMIGGQVRLPNGGPDGFLSVRSGPGAQFAEKDRLKTGTAVILLGPNKAWRAAVYPAAGTQTNDMEKTCGIPNPPPANWPVKKLYDGPCRSGWVNMRFVEQLAD